jgi:hypothetical protein
MASRSTQQPARRCEVYRVVLKRCLGVDARMGLAVEISVWRVFQTSQMTMASWS